MPNPVPKKIEDRIPPRSNYRLGKKLRLERPAHARSIDFFEVIQARHSSRHFGPLTLAQLGELLWYAAKVIGVNIDDNGYLLTHRPCASAGARHPVDLMVCMKTDDNLPALLFYNPFDHSLNFLINGESVAAALMGHINSNLHMGSGVFIWLLAAAERTAAKYEYHESLIWRDAGVLLHQIQLVATALQLASCPVGTLGSPLHQQVSANAGELIPAGGIIVGNLEL